MNKLGQINSLGDAYKAFVTLIIGIVLIFAFWDSALPEVKTAIVNLAIALGIIGIGIIVLYFWPKR